MIVNSSTLSNQANWPLSVERGIGPCALRREASGVIGPASRIEQQMPNRLDPT